MISGLWPVNLKTLFICLSSDAVPDATGLPYTSFDHSKAHFYRYDEQVSLCLERLRWASNCFRLGILSVRKDWRRLNKLLTFKPVFTTASSGLSFQFISCWKREDKAYAPGKSRTDDQSDVFSIAFQVPALSESVELVMDSFKMSQWVYPPPCTTCLQGHIFEALAVIFYP